MHRRLMGLLVSLCAVPLQAQTASWKDQGIVHTANSPHAKLHDVPIRAVTLADGFWAQRRKTDVEMSIPTMHELMVRDGRMENFRRLSGKSTAPQKGRVASDTDIYKWTEGASFMLQSGDRPELHSQVSGMLDDVVAAQEPGGYLNTYYQGDRVPLRMQWTTAGGGRGAQSTQETGHELYTLGHLLQAAIAYYRATGDRKLLDAGIRAVDNFVLKDYGPGADKKPIISGHPEIEMALVELYRITGDKRHLDLAGYILRGDPQRIVLRPDRYVYMFSGIPFTSRTKLEGHAVRAMYACSGATDYFLETGDPAYWKTLETLWKDLTDSKLYITGGVGARSAGEAFGDPYELPNGTAYSESCAAIGNMMWNWRMLAATGEARFTDVMERALYNTINAGMSLDGTQYCYAGDKVRLQLDMTPQVVMANPQLQDNRGRVAVERGPLVYCVEQLDQPGVGSLTDLALTVGTEPGKEFRLEMRKDLLGGIVVLQHPGVYFDKPLSQEPLYQPFGKASVKGGRAVSLNLIPYYAWANREPSAMQVWMAVRGR